MTSLLVFSIISTTLYNVLFQNRKLRFEGKLAAISSRSRVLEENSLSTLVVMVMVLPVMVDVLYYLFNDYHCFQLIPLLTTFFL